MTDLNKVIAGLEACLKSRPRYCFGCPYENAEYCHDEMFTEALELLKEQNRLIRELSDNIPCCDNCEGKTVFGERTDECVYEIGGLDGVLYCAKRGIENCFGYRKKIDALTEENRELRKDIAVLTEELTTAREKLSWLEPRTTPNDWGEYPPEFPREGM